MTRVVSSTKTTVSFRAAPSPSGAVRSSHPASSMVRAATTPRPKAESRPSRSGTMLPPDDLIDDVGGDPGDGRGRGADEADDERHGPPVDQERADLRPLPSGVVG